MGNLCSDCFIDRCVACYVFSMSCCHNTAGHDKLFAVHGQRFSKARIDCAVTEARQRGRQSNAAGIELTELIIRNFGDTLLNDQLLYQIEPGTRRFCCVHFLCSFFPYTVELPADAVNHFAGFIAVFVDLNLDLVHDRAVSADGQYTALGQRPGDPFAAGTGGNYIGLRRKSHRHHSHYQEHCTEQCKPFLYLFHSITIPFAYQTISLPRKSCRQDCPLRSRLPSAACRRRTVASGRNRLCNRPSG